MGADDVDITPIQTMHGPTIQARAQKLNLQVRSNLVNYVLEHTLGVTPGFRGQTRAQIKCMLGSSLTHMMTHGTKINVTSLIYNRGYVQHS